MDARHLDYSDPGTYANGFPHQAFRQLRREAPVHWQERDHEGNRGFWVISKYEDVKFVSKNPRLFSSRGSITIRDPIVPNAASQRMMLMMDPPEHARYRRLVSSGFTPRRIEALGPHIREIVRAILDGVAHKGECDFVTDVAAELPLQVIAEFLGVPQADRHKIFEWSNKLIGFEDPEFQRTMSDGMTAALEMYMYANRLAEERLRAPQDDIVSLLLSAEVEGEKLSTQEFNAFFLLLAVAGNETTRNLISHGMRLLIEHPEARARLLDDASLLPSAVEEMLRVSPPVMYFRRTATQDVEIRGTPIAKGDKVTVWYPSANRDEDVFPEPDRFDVARSPNDHLAFGIGEHFCLGSHLARIEIIAMFEQLLERMPDMQLAGPIRYLNSHFINGVKSMPVRFTASRR
jgi:cytochrome P450